MDLMRNADGVIFVNYLFGNKLVTDVATSPGRDGNASEIKFFRSGLVSLI